MHFCSFFQSDFSVRSYVGTTVCKTGFVSESNRVMDEYITKLNSGGRTTVGSYWRPHEPGDANQHINRPLQMKIFHMRCILLILSR